ncbi:MAG: Tol-Pal system protein TolB [Campylobacterales bacterium]|nr:Tol-Pal system protein TolB [Campylobacterales bacterium]
MIRHLLLLVTIFYYGFAIDATMEIIKEKKTLPLICIDSNGATLGKKISELVAKDLQVSGHFNLIDFSIGFDFESQPNFTMLQQNGIDLYLNIQTSQNQNNGVVVSIRLYDANSLKLVLSKSYTTSSQARYPFLAHKIAIDINGYLNAPSIAWMDKFVIFSRYLNARSSEIVIADYTLTYQQTVVKGGLNIFPKWANKEQESFYYTSYEFAKPTLMKQNIFTQKREKIVSSDGMVVCSDVSSDGRKLALTMAPNSQPDIYVYDTVTKIKTRVTEYSGIDVGGSFVENDKKIIFVSDRLKYPNIFAKTIGSKGVERMIYHGKNNSQCTTFKDYIVYSSRESDNEFGDNIFNLYLISTKSDYVRRLTTVGSNKFPKFSTDGESIMFIKNDSDTSYLGIIRLNYNKSFLFLLKTGKLQSIDW